MNPTNTPAKRERKVPLARTISEELHNAWTRLRRKKDPETIAEALGVSRPVIDKALLYGHVLMEGLAPKITKFFEDRLDQEKADAERLNQKADN
jgi:nitrogen regulatory protein PII-like uncharacterized protein